MTNSKKEFEKLWDKQTGGELIPNFIFPFISKVEQEAIYQERERILGIIETLQPDGSEVNYEEDNYAASQRAALESLKEKINFISMTTLDERFDQKFSGVQRGGFDYPVQYEIKSFIHSEVDLALKDYKERVIKLLKGMETPINPLFPNRCLGFNQALQQAINEINKLDI